MKNIPGCSQPQPSACLLSRWRAPPTTFTTPTVEYGEREIDFKYGTEKMKDSEGGGRTVRGSVGFGYGATQWWFTEAYVK